MGLLTQRYCGFPVTSDLHPRLFSPLGASNTARRPQPLWLFLIATLPSRYWQRRQPIQHLAVDTLGKAGMEVVRG